MAEEKPRIFQGGRDIALSLLTIIVVMVAAVAFTGMCTFNQGAPENGPVQEVDAQQFLSLEARAMPYPVRAPAMPEGWVPNSARRQALAGEPASVVGWVIGTDGYIQLTQTGAAYDTAVAEYDADPRELARTLSVAGHEVAVWTSPESDVRDLWTVDLGDVRLLLSGAATEELFIEAIDTTIATTPLPAAG